MTQPIERDPIYRGRRFQTETIELCVRWYITYRLSYRDLAAMMAERGVVVSHTTIMRWVLRYVPEYEERWDRYARPVNSSWRMDETAICVRGKLHYLYRAVDKHGKPMHQNSFVKKRSKLTADDMRPLRYARKIFYGSGLYLLVTPNGSRYWRYNYRFSANTTLSLLVSSRIFLSKRRGPREPPGGKRGRGGRTSSRADRLVNIAIHLNDSSCPQRRSVVLPSCSPDPIGGPWSAQYVAWKTSARGWRPPMENSFLPHTDERVPRHTAPHVNRKLRETTIESLRSYVGAERATIDARIEQLRKEWDVERTLEANASAIALAGLALGIGVDRRWLALPVSSQASCFSTRCKAGVHHCPYFDDWGSEPRPRSMKRCSPCGSCVATSVRRRMPLPLSIAHH